LNRFGVAAARLARASDALRTAAPVAAEQLPHLVAGAPDPSMALSNWEHLVDIAATSAALGTLTPAQWSALFTVLARSQTLSNALRSAAAGWVEVFRSSWAAAPCRAEDYGRELEDAVGVSWERFCEQLRQVRHRAYLRIGIADLIGRWPVEITMSELS